MERHRASGGNSGSGGRGFDGRSSSGGNGGGGKFRKSDSSSSAREPSQVQIFVEGLPPNVKLPDVVDYFSTVGKIKLDRETRKPRVWLYHDKQTGEPTGEVTVTYNDHETQKRALDTYNEQHFMDRFLLKVTPSIVKVHMAKPPAPSARPQRGRGGRGGSFRGGGRPGAGRGRERGGRFEARDRNFSSPSGHDRSSNYSPLGSRSQGRSSGSSGHRDYSNY